MDSHSHVQLAQDPVDGYPFLRMWGWGRVGDKDLGTWRGRKGEGCRGWQWEVPTQLGLCLEKYVAGPSDEDSLRELYFCIQWHLWVQEYHSVLLRCALHVARM